MIISREVMVQCMCVNMTNTVQQASKSPGMEVGLDVETANTVSMEGSLVIGHRSSQAGHPIDLHQPIIEPVIRKH